MEARSTGTIASGVGGWSTPASPRGRGRPPDNPKTGALRVRLTRREKEAFTRFAEGQGVKPAIHTRRMVREVV